jgi:hypothetical protein
MVKLSYSYSHWGPLVALTAALALFACTHVLLGKMPSPGAMAILPYASPFFLVLWVAADARRHGWVPCFDFAFLVALLFPLSLVWYLLWTRRWWGLLVLGLFAVLLLTPWLCALVVGMMMTMVGR